MGKAKRRLSTYHDEKIIEYKKNLTILTEKLVFCFQFQLFLIGITMSMFIQVCFERINSHDFCGRLFQILVTITERIFHKVTMTLSLLNNDDKFLL